jgi:hypothetical protein
VTIFNTIETILIEFIELRNLEKTEAYTLIDPPVISPNGIAEGGKIKGANGKEFEFVIMFNSSLLAITKFIEIVLQ